MIVNRSMFPLQTGFSVISNMQSRMADLQLQLGTGEKSSTLAGMGRDLPLSLSVRSRLARIEGYSANIDMVNLRLSFLNNTVNRFEALEAEARTSAAQGQYGTGNINLATVPDLSKARLDEIVTLLNSEVAGRYLFGGSKTDAQPVASVSALLDGQSGRAGFKTVAAERQVADLGIDGRGRLETERTDATVRLSEDGVHPFGMKVSTVSNPPGVSVGQPHPGAAPLGKQVTVTFEESPQITAGSAITIGLVLPDGTETQISLSAVNAGDAAGPDTFSIGGSADETAESFNQALRSKLLEVGSSTLKAASTFAAAENFFNSAGEPVLRVNDDPSLAEATSLRLATPSDTVMWYGGETASVAAEGLGRLEILQDSGNVVLSEKAPPSDNHGFRLVSAVAESAAIAAPLTAGATPLDGAAISFTFADDVSEGDKVTVRVAFPGGERDIELTATNGPAGPGQFQIGTAAKTAENFSKSLEASLNAAAKSIEGTPRQTVSAQVDASTRVNYGMQADESGLLALMRSTASMAITTYPTGDAADKARFDGMADRQATLLSENRNGEAGSIEILAMDMGIALSTLESASTRHTSYQAQLENLLADVETVSEEDVAMEILALQTRLQASYQVTAMVSQLSLAQFL